MSDPKHKSAPPPEPAERDDDSLSAASDEAMREIERRRDGEDNAGAGDIG